MTGRRPVLGSDERARIAAAIGRAEAGTAGEIVVIVAARAGLYRSGAPALALVAALLAPWPLISLTSLSVAAIAALQAATALLVLLLASDADRRLALVPTPIRRARVREAAAREFRAHGLNRTAGRTGVLVYVALGERHAEVVADAGVAARVPEAAWRGIVADLRAAAAGERLAEGLEAAVAGIGAVLGQALPSDADRDELPNRVIVLD